MPRVTKFEYPPLVTRPFIPRTQSKILEGTLGDKYEDKISKKSSNNTGQQKKFFLLVPQILELFWSIFGALIPKMTAVFSHQL